MRRYLQQLATFLAPASVDVGRERAAPVRPLAARPTPTLRRGRRRSRRDDIEDFKVWLAAQPGTRAAGRSAPEHATAAAADGALVLRADHRVGLARRARRATRSSHGDIPKKPEPLPKFLDDRDAARFMAAARASTDPRDRLVVELLARTGMRAGELGDLDADAVVQIGDGHWLRIPLGKLRNDRYVPLHPELVDLLADWTAANLEHIRAPPPAGRRSPRPARTGTSSAASSAASAAPPASPASTRTSCATPWPPRPSTAACASKRSPRCSATRRWR